MAEEPADLTLRLLQDIRAKQDEQGAILFELRHRLEHVDRRVEDLTRVLRYSMGQNEETAFRQSEQERRLDEQKKRTDELFDKLEELLSTR